MSAESPTSVGRRAEDVAARYVQGLGYTILARNWRTRFCELDIVAEHAGIIHIIEVKYRRTIVYGRPAEYVTRAKQLQLMRAAQAWLWQHRSQTTYQIDVIGVVGALDQPEIELIESAVGT